MKTIEIQLYSFNELCEDAKQVAIQQHREHEFSDNYVHEYATDDCYLFEPKHTEIVNLCPAYADYGMPIFVNTRKNMYYDLDRNSHLDCSNALRISNDKMFFEWLEIPEGMHDNVIYTIRATKERYPDTIIDFEENHLDYNFTDDERNILDNAEVKFSNHMGDILNRISEAYDYYFSDEQLTESILANDYEYTDDGKRY